MSKYIQVEGHSNLLRDEDSTAIINNDVNSYEIYKKRRETMKSQRNEINTLKDEVSEIKNLLHTLIEKVNG